MAREIVKRNRLEDMLQVKLNSFQDCEVCSFSPVVPLESVDPEGCNWLIPDLQCSEGLTYTRMRAAMRVLGAARQKYNIG